MISGRLQLIVYDRHRINCLYLPFNLSHAVQSELVRRIEDLHILLDREHVNVLNLVENYKPEVASITTVISNAVIIKSLDLQVVFDAFMTERKVATIELSRLLNFTDLAAVDPKHTKFLSIETSSDTIEFRFYVKRFSSSTRILRAVAFNYWSNLTEGDSVYNTYTGPVELVFTETNNCARGLNDIESSLENMVVVGCYQESFLDPRLNSWRREVRGLQSAKAEDSTFIASFPSSYIYCWPHTVVLDREYSCPPHVFKINSTEDVEVPGLGS